MREVVEHEAADRDLLDIQHAGGFWQVLQGRVIGMESQRDESLEAAGFVLQRAQFEQMIDAVFVVFDMAVEHGCVGLQPDLVGDSRSVEPLVGLKSNATMLYGHVEN